MMINQNVGYLLALRYPFSTPDCQRYRRYNQLFSIHQLVKSSKHLSISHVTVTRAITCIPTCVTEQGNFSRLQFITKTLLCDGSLTSLLRLCSHGCDRRFRLILCIVPSSFKDRTKRSRFDRWSRHVTHMQGLMQRRQGSDPSHLPPKCPTQIKKYRFIQIYKLLVWSKMFSILENIHIYVSIKIL